MIQTDVLIIGAGIIGAALARELARYQISAAVVEKEVDVSFGASKANSGIVHSGIHDRFGTLKAELCVKGNKLFPELAEELHFLYKNNGALIVAQQKVQLAELEELRKNGVANGISGIENLSPEDLLRLEPNLSPESAGGLLVPSGGIVVSFDMVFAMIENAVANGVRLFTGEEVLEINSVPNGFQVFTTKNKFETRYLVNAAGIHSAKVAGLIGDESFAIIPRKGEEYLMDRKLEGLVKRTIFPLPGPVSKGILVIPTVDGNLMIGPTAEDTDSFSDVSTSVEGWQNIYKQTKTILPSLNSSDLITSFAGLRAISDREDFIIEASPVSPRFLHAAGIKSPGLTAAPAIAKYLIDLLQESGLKLKIRKDFNPIRQIVRLREMSPDAKVKLFRKNPAYANIVCRCESISEGEIRDSIKRGATTLDGVKFRTRAGMGRCQGGFCAPKVIQILSEELGIEPERITKNGSGSELLTGKIRPIKE